MVKLTKKMQKIIHIGASLAFISSLLINDMNSINAAHKKIVVGFSQLGSESAWRIAETNSVKQAAKANGITLDFADGKQRQENQINAIRRFIKEKVNVIAIDPVVGLGWDNVLKDAKAAKIPVILLDRSINAPKSLYTTCIGSDFSQEGKVACRQLAKLLNNKGDIVEIEGTIGSAPEIGRKTGFRDELAKYPEIKIIKSALGNFTRASGKQIMKSLLETYGNKIQALFAHNDDMAIGAIQAIEEYGLKPGKDIKIISIDGVKGIFKAMIAGKANCTVECNPLLGPLLMKAVKNIINGNKLPKWIKSHEGFYTQLEAKAAFHNRKY